MPRTPVDNLIRLYPLSISELPYHPAFRDAQRSSDAPDLTTFIKAVLDQAIAFVDENTLLGTFSAWGEKTSPPATATVYQLSRTIKPSELSGSRRSVKKESWFARRSTHANRREKGTADWAEFDSGLRADHMNHEMEYTPNVLDAHKVVDWEQELADSGRNWLKENGYEEVSMSIYEMHHHMPFPLYNRVFPVLAVHARTSKSSFVVVQLPVDLTQLPQNPSNGVLYSNARNRRDGDSAVQRKRVVLGQYVSIERATTEDGNISWVMATASDAKGWLPMWLQKLGVPGAIVKDVGYFMEWTAKRRNSGA